MTTTGVAGVNRTSWGALNLITQAKRTQAAALVQTGETVSCARPITTDMAPDISHQVQRFMVDSGEGRDTDPLERRNSRRGAAEFIGMVFHGQTITHIDALSHYSYDGLMYNGVPAAVVTSPGGRAEPCHRPDGAGPGQSRRAA